MAETLDLLGITYGMSGDRVKVVEQLDQAIALFRILGDTQSLISSLAMRALQSMPGSSETTYCPLRTRDECVQDASESLLLARQTDSLAGQDYAESTLAWGELLLAQGEPAMALQMVEELLASAPGMVSAHSMQPIPHLLKLKGGGSDSPLKIFRLHSTSEDAITSEYIHLKRHYRPI